MSLRAGPSLRAGRARRAAPGLALVFAVAAAATFLGEHYGAPVMLFALLIGIAFHFLYAGPCARSAGRMAPGVDVAARDLLRVGVALLGLQIDAGDLAALGARPLVLAPLLISMTMLFGLALAAALGKTRDFGLLTGGAVAICGASAALAIAAVLSRRADTERDALFTVIAVTTLSTLAMVAYPILFAALGASDREVGMLIGLTIHDVAQVVGAGYAVSNEAGEAATLVKLWRVAFLPVVVVAIAFGARREDAKGAKGARAAVPLFAVAFAALFALNSAIELPETVTGAARELSRWLLVAAIGALGVKTSLKAMFDLGPRHLAVIVAETVFLLTIASLAVLAW